jgi:hypothetical protein
MVSRIKNDEHYQPDAQDPKTEDQKPLEKARQQSHNAFSV